MKGPLVLWRKANVHAICVLENVWKFKFGWGLALAGTRGVRNQATIACNAQTQTNQASPEVITNDPPSPSQPHPSITQGTDMTSPWCIIEYERGKHTALPNSLCRVFIPCVIPMVTDYNPKARIEIYRPALYNLAFIPCDESLVQRARDVRYVEDVWRDDRTGILAQIPDAQLQGFMDGLSRREKKPASARKALRLGEMAERDWFAILSHLYGAQTAIKRFGRDMREVA